MEEVHKEGHSQHLWDSMQQLDYGDAWGGPDDPQYEGEGIVVPGEENAVVPPDLVTLEAVGGANPREHSNSGAPPTPPNLLSILQKLGFV